MAARAKRTTQPAAVTGVDWGNPITRSLVTAFSAGGGTNPVDATNFRPWARQYGDDFQLAPSIGGYALVNGASVNYKVTSPVSMIATAGQTVVVVVTPLASITVESPFAQADNGGWYAGTMYVGDGTNPRFAAGGWSGSAQRATAPTDYVLKQRYIVASRVNPSGTLDLFIDGVLVASNSATIGNLSYARPLVIRSPSNTAKSIAYGGAAGFSRALSDFEIKALSDNFWQIFASPSKGKRFAAGAASGTAAITQADGVSTASTLSGSSVASTTLTAAAGTSTASGITGGATAAAAITDAAGVSTASSLTGEAATATVITGAAGTSTASTIVGFATGAGAITQAGGVTAAAALAGASVSVLGVIQAGGTSATSTLAGVVSGESVVTQASGVSTASGLAGASTASTAVTQASSATATSTLVGQDLAAGVSGIAPAVGSSSASNLTGASTAVCAASSAAGFATAETLAGTGVSNANMSSAAGTSSSPTLTGIGVSMASMSAAGGASTAAAFAASAVAASVAIATAGASSAAAIAGIPPSTANYRAVFMVVEDDRTFAPKVDVRDLTVQEERRDVIT